MIFFFFFNDTATTEIYTLSLHDALPISSRDVGARVGPARRRARRRERRPRAKALARRRRGVRDRGPPVVAGARRESAPGPRGSAAVRRESLRAARTRGAGGSEAARSGAGALTRTAGGCVLRGGVGAPRRPAPRHGVRAGWLGGGCSRKPAHGRRRLDGARSGGARRRAAGRATGPAARGAGGRPARLPLPVRRRTLVPTIGRRDLHRPLGAGAVRIHRG